MKRSRSYNSSIKSLRRLPVWFISAAVWLCIHNNNSVGIGRFVAADTSRNAVEFTTRLSALGANSPSDSGVSSKDSDIKSLTMPIVPSSILSPRTKPKRRTTGRNIICVGGSSGMGKAAALECLLDRGSVLLISRSLDKLKLAREELTKKVQSILYPDDDDDDDNGLEDYFNRIQIQALDVSNEIAVQDFAKSLPENVYDGLIISVADKAPHGPMQTLPTSDTRFMMETKVWTAYNCAKYVSTKLQDGGGVVFVSGILNRRPGLNCVPLAMANGALEGLTRSLALEWGPSLRVNCLSPGFCDTERFDHMPAQRKKDMLANTAASLPLQRVGEARDMGEALYYLATSKFVTGVVLDVDGGHSIRQYASPVADPMRSKTS